MNNDGLCLFTGSWLWERLALETSDIFEANIGSFQTEETAGTMWGVEACSLVSTNPMGRVPWTYAASNFDASNTWNCKVQTGRFPIMGATPKGSIFFSYKPSIQRVPPLQETSISQLLTELCHFWTWQVSKLRLSKSSHSCQHGSKSQSLRTGYSKNGAMDEGPVISRWSHGHLGWRFPKS